VNAGTISKEVLEKHFDTIKSITKSFTEKENNEYYTECAPFTPLLAWATQFFILAEHERTEIEVEQAIKKIEVDIEEKKFKKDMIKQVIEQFNKDDFATFFKKDLE
jgi:hypothetical protein